MVYYLAEKAEFVRRGHVGGEFGETRATERNARRESLHWVLVEVITAF